MNAPLSGQRAFTVSDLAQYGSPRTWRRIISRGEIGVLRIGGAVKIPEAELERFLAERFTPARKRQEDRPQTVAEAIDRVLPRLRDGRSWIQPSNETAPPLPDWIISALRPSTPPQAVSSDADGLPPGVGEGQRNDAAARVAGRYLAKLRPEEAWPILQAWNRKNSPPLPEGELRATLFNIARKERDKGPVIDLVDSCELLRLVGPPKAKLIDPFLPAGSKAILAAWQGSYKTTLLLNFAFCINNALPVFGRFDTTKGRVLYIDRENNPELTHLRVEKIASGLHGMHGGITFQFPKEKPDLADRRVREAYMRIIDAGKFDLVVFDSFLCFFNLRNENDNTEVRNVLELVGEIPARTGAAILFIDHAGKASPEKAKAGIKVTPRGASAKGDWWEPTWYSLRAARRKSAPSSPSGKRWTINRASAQPSFTPS